MPSVTINDKLYARLKSFCSENGKKVKDAAEDAVNEYLMKEQYGDAPFMVQQVEEDVENRQIYQEPTVEIDKNTEKGNSLLENLENSGMISVESIKSDEQGNVEVHMKKLDGIDSIQTKFTVHNDGTVEIDKNDEEQKVPQRPTKRRL